MKFKYKDYSEIFYHTFETALKYIPEMENLAYVWAFRENRYERWSLDFILSNGIASTNVKYDISPRVEKSMNWSINLTLPKEPVEFKFDQLTHDLTLSTYPIEEFPQESDKLSYLRIDRNGNER